MSKTNRLSPQAVREQQLQGDALLVCAYDDAEKCRRFLLTDALTLDELAEQLPTDRRIVFYCG